MGEPMCVYVTISDRMVIVVGGVVGVISEQKLKGSEEVSYVNVP